MCVSFGNNHETCTFCVFVFCVLCCSDSGRYIGVGTISGGVIVYSSDLKVCVCVCVCV